MGDNVEDRRMIELETRIAHQDKVIQELSDSIAEQWKTIDALTRRLKSLRDNVGELDNDLRGLMPDESPPPHY